jgi:predicted nucleotidyltransferase
LDIQEERRQNAEQVMARLKRCLPAVLAEYPVDAAYVYGSVARGTATPLSDVDIAVLLTEPLSSRDRLKLELTIQGEIETRCGLSPVDVRAINGAPLMVQGRVVQQGRLVYERDRARRVHFEVMTRKRYFDFAPVARHLQEAFLERVRQDGLRYD